MAEKRNFSIELKQHLLQFHSLGQSTSEICKSVKDLGYYASQRGVRTFIQRVLATEDVHRKKRTKAPSVITPVHRQFIDMGMEKNPEITAEYLQQRLFDAFNVVVSVRHVRSIRMSLGWQSRQVGYCQMISIINKKVRFNWCLDVLSSRKTFHNVIFVDETSMEMSSAGRLFFYQERSSVQNMPRKAPKPKHAYKVNSFKIYRVLRFANLHPGVEVKKLVINLRLKPKQAG